MRSKCRRLRVSSTSPFSSAVAATRRSTRYRPDSSWTIVGTRPFPLRTVDILDQRVGIDVCPAPNGRAERFEIGCRRFFETRRPGLREWHDHGQILTIPTQDPRLAGAMHLLRQAKELRNVADVNRFWLFCHDLSSYWHTTILIPSAMVRLYMVRNEVL